MRKAGIERAFMLSLAIGLAQLPGIAGAQTLNQSIEAMEQGDFQRAFSTLRRLEQSGDPRARVLLDQMFGAPVGSAPPLIPPIRAERIDPETAARERAATRPAAAAPAQPPGPARGVPAAPQPRASLSPSRSLRPPLRPRPSEEPAAPEAEIIALPAPLEDEHFRPVDERLARLGHLLFHDPILSGNKDTSCASCHLSDISTQSGPPGKAPRLWNLGARDVGALTHDGRFAVDPDVAQGFATPHGPLRDRAVASVLAAQALFAPEKMAGHGGENPVADALRDGRMEGEDGVWGLLAARIAAIPAYRVGFEAYRGAEAPLQMDEIANALAAFIEWEFRATDSPFDRYLREEAALSSASGEGMRLFYGKAGCATCHAGALLSDQGFHAMGQPPLDMVSAPAPGREGVTGQPEDAFAMRTPMLRNVAVSGAWGHGGAFTDLRAFLVHHLDPVAGLDRYAAQAREAGLDQTALAQLDNIRTAAGRAMLRRPLVVLQDDEIDFLRAFLDDLTDAEAASGRMGIPAAVPSGLPLDP